MFCNNTRTCFMTCIIIALYLPAGLSLVCKITNMYRDAQREIHPSQVQLYLCLFVLTSISCNDGFIFHRELKLCISLAEVCVGGEGGKMSFNSRIFTGLVATSCLGLLVMYQAFGAVSVDFSPKNHRSNRYIVSAHLNINNRHMLKELYTLVIYPCIGITLFS